MAHANESSSNMESGGTSNFIRGQTTSELNERQKQLQAELASLPAQQQESVLARFHGGRTDLSTQRLRHLQQDDANENTTKLSAVQRWSLEKRRADRGIQAALRRQTVRRETKRLGNALEASRAEEILHTFTPGFVEVENDMEKTLHLTQVRLKHDRHLLPETVARNIFDLDLKQSAPYKLTYDRSGRYALLSGSGSGGHVAIIDQHSLGLKTEFFLGQREKVRDACFLHNPTMMAVAQEKNVFIYDDKGVEIHRLDNHRRVLGMEFLPYHWLLATVSCSGLLQYQDTSTGTLISQHRSKLGPCHVIRQNPFNSVLHLGHANGTVTLWSPSSSEYLVKIQCNKGSPITGIAIDRSGRYMATGAGDSRVKLWDLRMYKETYSLHTNGGPPTALDISQTGILGIGHGCNTTFFKPEALTMRISQPYMKHQLSGRGPVESLRFRPFEDVCGIGHAGGISSIVIPGSGEPNLDSFEHFTNPYMDSKQRREAEVRSLLEKLSPDMIALDPEIIGSIEESNMINQRQRLQDLAEEADVKKTAEMEAAKNKKEKKRMRGRSKIAKKLQRKQKNIIDENLNKLKEAREREKAESESKKSGRDNAIDEDRPKALRRFF